MSDDALAALLDEAGADGTTIQVSPDVIAKRIAERGVVVLPPAVAEVLRTGEPNEAMINGALNVLPERKFVPAIPYGGTLAPELSREEMRTALRAALARMVI